VEDGADEERVDLFSADDSAATAFEPAARRTAATERAARGSLADEDEVAVVLFQGDDRLEMTAAEAAREGGVDRVTRPVPRRKLLGCEGCGPVAGVVALLVGGAAPEAGAEFTAAGEQPLERRADDGREVEQRCVSALLNRGLARDPAEKAPGEQLPLVEQLVEQRAGEGRVAAPAAPRAVKLAERIAGTICCTAHRISSLDAEMN
jgi:hypothetical protein